MPLNRRSNNPHLAHPRLPPRRRKTPIHLPRPGNSHGVSRITLSRPPNLHPQFPRLQPLPTGNLSRLDQDHLIRAAKPQPHQDQRLHHLRDRHSRRNLPQLPAHLPSPINPPTIHPPSNGNQPQLSKHPKQTTPRLLQIITIGIPILPKQPPLLQQQQQLPPPHPHRPKNPTLHIRHPIQRPHLRPGRLLRGRRRIMPNQFPHSNKYTWFVLGF